ncbi:MAG: hypothetical protein JNK15_03100 [Planctomycetes bacterium]|nr:hypothetical protein [Planctomycetota bacterium]
MTNLTESTPRTFRGARDIVVMAAAGVLHAGAMVEEDGSGTLQNLTGAGTTFVGCALQSASAAADRIEVADRATVRLTVAKATNWAATDVGATVYASDGNAFTLVSTSNQTIGKVVEIESGIGSTSAVVWVYIEGQGKRSL